MDDICMFHECLLKKELQGHRQVKKDHQKQSNALTSMAKFVGALSLN